MKLVFHGHDYRYAVEQSLLAFFPQERPVYDGDQGEDWAQVDLACQGETWTAVTELCRGGRARGEASVTVPAGTDPYEAEREKQKAVKLSFFHAARALTGVTPPWGALTGIRPGKLAARLLEAGKTEEETERELSEVYCVSRQRRRMCLETAKAGLAARRDLGPRDIAVYIGIPFCPTRCAYCSFVSNSVEKSFHLVEPYLEALHQEIEDAARMVKELGLRVRSFYMGGGTPTTLTAEQMDRLLGKVESAFDLSASVETTVEAGRPDTITREKLEVLRRHGVSRISVNPQTMEDHVLRAIGRRHTAGEIREIMGLVSAMGFPHVNMDLIAGLPQDTPEGFRQSLTEVMAFGTDNLTVHTLSLKKGSRITLEGSRIPTEAEVGEMLSFADPTLRGAGFAPYYLYRQKYQSGSFENTGWCKEGGEGWYNIYIMEELHTILSMGAGGSTKMVDRAGGRIQRAFNLKFPQEYIQRPEKIVENHQAFRAFYQQMG